MKMNLHTGSLLIGLSMSVSAVAVPYAPRPVSELLGLRSTPKASFASGAPVSVAAPSRVRAYTPVEADGTPTIYASVVFPENAIGVWAYGIDEWNPKQVSISREILATGGGFAAKGYYYFTRYQSMMGFEEIKTFSYNIADWTETDTYTGEINHVATTMAYSPALDEAYGCFINESRTGYNLVRWNYQYFRPQAVVAPIERPWSGCAFSSDGTLYAIERNGDLYTVNLLTGKQTLVGKTGIESTYAADAIIDTATDIMYWCVANEEVNALYKVDIRTAAATKLYDLAGGEQLCGMFIDSGIVSVPADAPAKTSSIQASFGTGKLEGKLGFYSPRYTKGGTALPAEEEINYTVKANGKTVASGKVLPGKRVDAGVTLPEANNYYFTVSFSNAAGESEVTGMHKYVGIDTPRFSSALSLRILNGKPYLSWSRVSSTGVNGGDVDNYSATYTVVRQPDGKVLLDNGTALNVTDELPAPEVRTDYYYTLVGKVGELETAPVTSVTMSLGPIMPPYSGTFTNSASPAGWTFIDANADETAWGWYSGDKAIQISSTRGFDDWAVTPAVKVKKGISYPVTLSLQTSSREETFEVMWGTEPTVEAMTNVLIAETKFKSTAATDFKGELTPAEEGRVYIGIHAKTASPSSKINIVTITIENGQSADAPAAPADFSAESPVDGTAEVTVKMKAPSLTVGGAALEGDKACTKIEISRDGKLIHTVTEGIAPGAEVVYTDKADDLTLGMHTYSAVASNAFGEGLPAEKEVLVGARKPVAPAEATMVEAGNDGKVTVSWTPVTTDVDGNTISADAVTYRVIDRQKNTVASNVKGTSVTLQAVEEGEQAFCQFGVYAVTAGGESDKMAATAYKPVGKPYASPWKESFADKTVSSIFGYNYIHGTTPWSFVSNCEWGVVPQDEDGGFAYFDCSGRDLTALVTGKIDLAGLNSPSFIYYAYNYSSGTEYNNSITIEADRGDGRGFVKVREDIIAKTGPVNQWNKVVVPLTDFEGEAVIFRIVPGNPELIFYAIDNLRVSSYVEDNLSVTKIDAPRVADNGKLFEINVLITNTGENPVSSYTVELWKNGELADYRDCSRLAPDESKTTTFEQTLGAIDGGEVVYKAVVICDRDNLESDNTSEEITVGNMSPVVPRVSDLTAASAGNGVNLTWTAPDLTKAAPEAFTENFDGAEGWSSVVEGWKFVDMDKTPFGGINTPNFPCIGLLSWFVVNNTWSGIQSGDNPAVWAARSGKQYLASGYVMRSNTPVQSDDWAITPVLYSGAAQVLSFYAKSFNPEYLETFEVLASAGTTALEDFKSLGSVIDVPNAWTNYRFRLPEGTKYAAIRSRSIDKYFLFIDDVTFVPASGEPRQLTLKGYNVYRNGIKLNSEPLAAPGYTDETAVVGRDYSYVVTAVYDAAGESAASNAAAVTMSGIGGIDASSAVTVRTVAGGIAVSGLTEGSVAVYTADGRTVAVADAAPEVRIALGTGIYIVRAGTVTSRVAVR